MRRFILLATLLPLTAARAADTQPAPVSQPADFSLTLHVRSQGDNHTPIAGAAIINIGAAGDTTPLALTGPDGAARITLPVATLRNAALLASHDGFVSAYKELSRTPPADLTFLLEPATPLGGKVRDTNGNPFKNATVIITASKKYPALNQTGYTHIRAITNANGNFTSSTLPESFDHASVGLYSLDALSDYWYPLTDMHSLDDIRHWAAALSLPPGTPISITLTSPDNALPQDAVLHLGKDWDIGNGIPPIPFPPSGKLTLGLTASAHILATAAAPGFAPQQLALTPATDKPFTFSLHKATPLTLTIVDPSGKPLPAARAYIRKWGDVAMLFDLHAKDGHATWTDAPDPGPAAILADITAPGFVAQSDVPLTPGRPNTITLTPRPTITLLVTDADTHQPLPAFHVREGLVFKPGAAPVWQGADFDSEVQRPAPGTATFKPSAAYEALALAVTADNHLPATTPAFKVDATDHTFPLALKPGKNTTGALLDDDGKPVPNTPLYLLTSLPQIQNNRLADYEAAFLPKVTTDKNGHFSIPPQLEPYALLALTDEGLATAPRKAISPDTPLTLTFHRFGTLEGDITLNHKPAPEGTKVSLQDPPNVSLDQDEPLFSSLNALSTLTDKSGHFTLTRILPGGHTLSTPLANPTPFQIVPTKTSHTQIPADSTP